MHRSCIRSEEDSTSERPLAGISDLERRRDGDLEVLFGERRRVFGTELAGYEQQNLGDA